MWQRRILLCKITSSQNDNPFGGNRQEIIFFGAPQLCPRQEASN